MLPPAPGTSMRVNVRQVAAELGVHVDAVRTRISHADGHTTSSHHAPHYTPHATRHMRPHHTVTLKLGNRTHSS